MLEESISIESESKSNQSQKALSNNQKDLLEL